MKHALFYFFLCILVNRLAPIARAQSPEDCVSDVVIFGNKYVGTYDGDFSGEVAGHFFLDFGDSCNPPAIGQVRVGFTGPLAEYLGVGTFLESACVFSDGSFSTPFPAFRIQGAVDFGTCVVTGTWRATRPDDLQNPRSGEFTMTRLDPVPSVFKWTALNGDFHNASNWDPEEVPGAGQTAVFDQNQSYAVSFGTPGSSDGFMVEQGSVTFLTGSYAATGGSEVKPSAVVGTSIGNNVFLSLSSHNLTTAFSTFAPGLDHRAGIDVVEGSNWIEQARMVIGGEGSATLDIGETASVTSLETQIGAELSGEGVVELTPEFTSKGAAAEWTTGNIAVGLRGKGTVNHRGGSIQSHTVAIGAEPGSAGAVTVGSVGNTAVWEFDGDLEVGEGGDGELDIVAGGFVASTSSGLISAGGLGLGGEGTIRLEGVGSELSAPDSNLGVGTVDGRGLMTLANGAKAACDFALIGGVGSILISDSQWMCNQFHASASATVILLNGTLNVADSLDFQPESRLFGTGSITAPNAVVSGVVAPGPVNIALPAKGLPEEDEPIGTLTFSGNVDFGSATLEIDIAGLAEGNFDVIHAAGAVDIQNATVLFSFIDGFPPRTGDTVPFLMADGGLTVANLVLEFKGVAEGFQFETREADGMLVFEALNDAHPLGGEPTPAPTALNPAADVNGDNIIDDDDLFQVMENWYRIVPD